MNGFRCVAHEGHQSGVYISWPLWECIFISHYLTSSEGKQMVGRHRAFCQSWYCENIKGLSCVVTLLCQSVDFSNPFKPGTEAHKHIFLTCYAVPNAWLIVLFNIPKRVLALLFSPSISFFASLQSEEYNNCLSEPLSKTPCISERVIFRFFFTDE